MTNQSNGESRQFNLNSAKTIHPPWTIATPGAVTPARLEVARDHPRFQRGNVSLSHQPRPPSPLVDKLSNNVPSFLEVLQLRHHLLRHQRQWCLNSTIQPNLYLLRARSVVSLNSSTGQTGVQSPLPNSIDDLHPSPPEGDDVWDPDYNCDGTTDQVDTATAISEAVHVAMVSQMEPCYGFWDYEPLVRHHRSPRAKKFPRYHAATACTDTCTFAAFEFHVEFVARDRYSVMRMNLNIIRDEPQAML